MMRSAPTDTSTEQLHTSGSANSSGQDGDRKTVRQKGQNTSKSVVRLSPRNGCINKTRAMTISMHTLRCKGENLRDPIPR